MKRTSGLHTTMRIFWPADKHAQEAVVGAYKHLDNLKAMLAEDGALILEEKTLFTTRELAEHHEPEGEDNSDLLDEGEVDV
jgi:hypothetical protein